MKSFLAASPSPSRCPPPRRPTIVLVPGASHVVMVSHPAEVVKVIEDAAASVH